MLILSRHEDLNTFIFKLQNVDNLQNEVPNLIILSE